MSVYTKAGLTAGVVLALACASLPGSATASSHQPSAAPTSHQSQLRQGALPDRSFTPAAHATAMKYAVSRTTSLKAQLGLSAAQGLHVQDVERDANGAMHLHYNRTLGGLKVYGGDFIV